jgi:hypothetical protein
MKTGIYRLPPILGRGQYLVRYKESAAIGCQQNSIANLSTNQD